MTVAERIASRARAEGLDKYFGLPGSGALMDLMDAGRRVGLDLVLTGHESSAAITAAYYGYFRGGAGLAIGIKGPGAGNLLGGAVNAYFERMPVVCLCERAPRGNRLQQMTQQVDQAPFFESIANACEEIRPDGDPGAAIDRAFAAAGAARPGPALLECPSDAGMSDAVSEQGARPTPGLAAPPPPSETVAATAATLGTWRRPVVILGPDIARSHALPAVAPLIERLRAAVMLGTAARGLISEDDPRFAGVYLGLPGKEILANRILAEADGALLIGMDPLSVEGAWTADLPTIELTASSRFETVSPAPVARADGDLSELLRAITAGLAPNPERGFDPDLVAAIRRDTIDRCFRRPAGARLTAHDVVAVARELLPDDGVLVSETGAYVLLLDHLWCARRPDTFFGSAGGRTMGLTIPAALGVKLARPATPVIGMGGDGSLLMRLGELETFARTGASLPLIIINDQAHGTIRARQKIRGLTPYSLGFAPVDYAAVARASGIGGITITDPEQLRGELTHALESEVATLIDVRVDPGPYQDGFGPTAGTL